MRIEAVFFRRDFERLYCRIDVFDQGKELIRHPGRLQAGYLWTRPEIRAIEPQPEGGTLDISHCLLQRRNSPLRKRTDKNQRDVPVSAVRGRPLNRVEEWPNGLAQNLPLPIRGPQGKKQSTISHEIQVSRVIPAAHK